MRRSLVIVFVLLGISLLFVGGPSLLFSPSTDAVAPDTASQSDPEIVSLEDSDSGFWPYLNDRKAHEKRSPVNVIVRGNTTTIVELLAEHGDGDWRATDQDHFSTDEFAAAAANETPTEGDANESADSNGTSLGPISPTAIPWSQADGATRHAYLDPGPDEPAYWTTETVQLEDGEYYGYRYHIRAYESPNPDDRWIIMQTHSEHFDWFTLRHRVDGVEQAQSRLESDLMAIPGVDTREDVRRIYLGNEGPSDANGWATKLDLAAVALVVGLAAGRNRDPGRVLGGPLEAYLTESDRVRLRAAADRLDARHLLLAATVIAIVLGVRIAGIALDRTVDSLSAHGIAAVLYPCLAVGLPVAAYAIANGLERRLDAAVAASLSLAIAIWLDYSLLGVDVLPIDVVVQRMLVVIAFGSIAAGAARRATRDSRLNALLIGGVTMWTLVLVGTLLGYL
ncbi:hypothetical protein [Halopiger djelfimassiliensis]|uniref:hypothetical protein n=1 Tax=Halopiger djelfimassiliensis TaxID=1293047 RepID=UPI0006778E90|nr:hypothetical protein [Halopiger djelfimassiliensis]